MKSNDKFYLDKYAKYRNWIQERLEDGFGWENIKYGLRNDEEGLLVFLSQQRVNMFWDIDLNEWLELVEFEVSNNDEMKKEIKKEGVKYYEK